MPKPTLPWMNLLAPAQEAGLGRREQLVQALRRAMLGGQLSSGEQLPSSRVLASDLGLSRVTVEAAYGRLEAEGYLQRRVGRGSFVKLDLSASTPSALRGPVTKGLTGPAELSRRGLRIHEGGGCSDPQFTQAFAAGSPDLRAFPHALWRQLWTRHLRAAPLGMGYGDPQGHEGLREAIAAYLNASRGLHCRPEQVLVLSSSQQALQLIAHLLLDEGDRVWQEEPGYRGAATVWAAAGAELQAVPVDAEGLPPNAPYAAPKLVYLTPSHQYPCGMALSLPRRLSWLERAKQEGLWLVEDDYDSEFHYEGRPMPALQGLDRNGRVLYLGTFSKTLFPSLRLAYLVLPEALVAPFVVARSLMDGHPAPLPPAVTADFLRQGHFSAHLRLMRQLYAERREVLLEALQPLNAWLKPHPSPGGLQLAATLAPGQEARLSRAAAERGVLTPGLSGLYRGRAAQDGWLLGYSALTPTEIRLAAKTLQALKHPSS